MDESLREEFRTLLLEERARIFKNAAQTVNDDLAVSTDDMAEEGDQAQALRNQEMALRMRDREKYLLSKINAAITRLDNDEYGDCDLCGDEIELGRLRARPVATLCIECKEFQERQERGYADPRQKSREQRSSFRDGSPSLRHGDDDYGGSRRSPEADLSNFYDDDVDHDVDLDDGPDDMGDDVSDDVNDDLGDDDMGDDDMSDVM